MKVETAATDKINQPPGIRHWLFQIVPPLLMFGVLLTTRNGTSLVFVASFLLLPVLVSLISIIAKLIFFNRKKYHLVRPVLTIAVFILILCIAHWTYQIALDRTVDEVSSIHQQCNEELACPESPVGWQKDGSGVSRKDFGLWFKYIALYRYNKGSFSIRVYQGPDIGDTITGGVDLPFKVAPYEDGPNH
jgi:hypothetical protein